MRDGQAQIEQYHLVKPFLGGPDFAPFFEDMGNFLLAAKRLSLPPSSRILDVACGPGWVVHFLAKLGHSVLGIDICEHLLDCARKRIAEDPRGPFQNQPLKARFQLHDIEASPLPGVERFDAATLFSALHHFHDPISALENIRAALTGGGLLVIVEGTKPPEGSAWALEHKEIMEKYHTLERPYTRPQLEQLLSISGFPHYEFLSPLCDLFPLREGVLPSVNDQIVLNRAHNFVIASPSREKIVSLFPGYGDPLVFLNGFYAEERRPDGSGLRWSENHSRIYFRQAGVTLRFRNWALPPQRTQRISIRNGPELVAELHLRHNVDQAVFHFDDRFDRTVIDLHSDQWACPAWDGADDARLLSFVVDSPA
jgi:SAM-dependent methyltransferase